MNSCNARGFLQIGGGSTCVLKNVHGTFTSMEGGYAFFFNDCFDVFQNGRISLNNCIADVYLKNDTTKDCVLLSSTDYIIFPNTSLPLSYPFFSFLKKGSYLFIQSEKKDLSISIFYDALILKSALKDEIKGRCSYPYISIYELQSKEFYSFNKELHTQIETSIEY